jgi:hypothetical protein
MVVDAQSIDAQYPTNMKTVRIITVPWQGHQEQRPQFTLETNLNYNVSLKYLKVILETEIPMLDSNMVDRIGKLIRKNLLVSIHKVQ